MLDVSRTTTALLQGLHDPQNDAVWSAFDARYRPILVGFARRLGLGDADAADVAQDTLAQFVKEYRRGRYDRNRSRLRSWLVGIARYRVAELHRHRVRRREQAGQSILEVIPDDDELTRLWEQQRRQTVLREAMEHLRHHSRTSDRNMQVFEMLMIHHLAPEVVAQHLQISVAEVYLAKSRIAQRLRRVIRRLEALYDAEQP